MPDFISFHKFSATGNDFILLDNREINFSEREVSLFQRLCHRRTGVGSDGVLLLDNNEEHDFRLRYFNADGSETECGNGARAAAWFAAKAGIAEIRSRFEFGRHIYAAEVFDDGARITMPHPVDLDLKVGLTLPASWQEGGFVNTGVPHYVIFADDIDEIDVASEAPSLRRHTTFGEAGANIDFVSVADENSLTVRTFERGVEGETLSCGSGCVASALIAHATKGAEYPVAITTPGGELHVDHRNENYTLEGAVCHVFDGTFRLQDFA